MPPSPVSVSVSATGTVQSVIVTPSAVVNLANTHHDKAATLSEQEQQAMIDGAASAKSPGTVNIKHGGYIDGTVGPPVQLAGWRPPTPQQGVPKELEEISTYDIPDAEYAEWQALVERWIHEAQMTEADDASWIPYMALLHLAMLEGDFRNNVMVRNRDVFVDGKKIRIKVADGAPLPLHCMQRRDAEGAAPGAAANTSPGRGHWTENLSAEEVREVMAQMEERGSAGKDGGESNVEVTADGVVNAGTVALPEPGFLLSTLIALGVTAGSIGAIEAAKYHAKANKENNVQAAVLAKRGQAIRDFAGAMKAIGEPVIDGIANIGEALGDAWQQPTDLAARDLTATSDSHAEDDDIQVTDGVVNVGTVRVALPEPIFFTAAITGLIMAGIGSIGAVELAARVNEANQGSALAKRGDIEPRGDPMDAIKALGDAWLRKDTIAARDLTATSDSHAEEDDVQAAVLAKRFDAFPFGKSLRALKKAWWDEPRSRTRDGRRLTRRYGSRALAARDITTSPAAAAHDSHAQDAAEVQGSAITKRDKFAQASHDLAQSVVDAVENAPARPKTGAEAERAERLKEARRKEEEEAARKEEKGSSVARRAASGLEDGPSGEDGEGVQASLGHYEGKTRAGRDAATSAAGAKGLSVRGAFVVAFLASTFFLAI